MRKTVFFIGCFLCFSKPSFAFDYFGTEINYWQRNQNQESEPTAPAKKPKFDWHKALDTNSEEFFREGDYLPPAPFMELVRNPTDENIKNWFTLVEKKNDLAVRLEKKMQQYVSKTGLQGPPATAEPAFRQMPNTAGQPDTDFKRYRFRLYYRSTCPHCQRMIKTLAEIQARGFFVEVRQVDRNKSAAKDLPFPLSYADEAELREKGIAATPVLLVGDSEKKVIYRINGYHSTEEIFSTIKNRQNL